MSAPKDLMYAKSHEWVKFLDDGTALTGFADYAQNQLGDIIFLNAPSEGDEVMAGEPYGDIESVKAVSDIYSPVSGKVIEINEEVVDEPGKINADPYGSWIIKIGDITDKGDFLDPDAYDKHVEEAEEA
jgi:glycine cleavage system H protein